MTSDLEYLRQLEEEFDNSPEGIGFQLRLDFAEILWRGLQQHNWSQTRFADESGWSNSFISNLVNANQNCELDTIGKALHVLGLRAKLVAVANIQPDRISFGAISTDDEFESKLRLTQEPDCGEEVYEESKEGPGPQFTQTESTNIRLTGSQFRHPENQNPARYEAAMG